MSQPWGPAPHQPSQQPPRAPSSGPWPTTPYPPQPRPPQSGPWPAPYPPAPAAPERSGGFRYVALACVTLVALGGLVLAGLLLFPRDAPAPVLVAPMAGAPATVAAGPAYVASAGSGSSSSGAGGYSCGSTGGHSVYVQNGTVPCDHALSVASQWLTTGTTPGSGAGAAGTLYSWSCTGSGSGDGWCTSKMGSHLSIGA